MSYVRDAVQITLGGKIDAQVQMLQPNRGNWFQWSGDMEEFLGGKGLWEGITVNPDGFLMSEAIKQWKDQAGKQKSSLDTGALLLQAIESGDEAAVEKAMRMCQLAEHVSPSKLKRSPVKRTPAPEFFIKKENITHRRSRSDDEDEEPEEVGQEQRVDAWLKQNAKAMHFLKMAISPLLREKHIKVKMAAQLWNQLRPRETIFDYRVLTEESRKLSLTDPRRCEEYLQKIYHLKARLCQIKDSTKNGQQREADLLENALLGLDFRQFQDVLRLFNKSDGSGPPHTIEAFEEELRAHCDVTVKYLKPTSETSEVYFGDAPRFKGSCNTCGKTGHKAADCRNDRTKQEEVAKPRDECSNCGKVGHKTANCWGLNKLSPTKPRRDRKKEGTQEISCMSYSLGGELSKEEHHRSMVALLDALQAPPASILTTQVRHFPSVSHQTKLRSHEGEPVDECPQDGKEETKEENVETSVTATSNFLPLPEGETPFAPDTSKDGISEIPSVGTLLGGSSTGPITLVRGKTLGSHSQAHPKVFRPPLQEVTGWPNNTAKKSLFKMGPRQPNGAPSALLPRRRTVTGTVEVPTVEQETGVVCQQHPWPGIHGGKDCRN